MIYDDPEQDAKYQHAMRVLNVVAWVSVLTAIAALLWAIKGGVMP